jgi:hypothetical protein
MDFRETLSAQLPPSRPDEPARLRQDILDELNDHLVCAYNREILRGADRSAARRRVLERFGDPAAVACGLWLDAMRGKIMAQRVVIGTCVLVAAACLALVGLFWHQTIQVARQAAVAEAREREMLKQLHEMTEAIQHPRSLDWNSVKLSFTEESAAGPPARGVSVVLLKLSDPSAKGINRESNESGVADFGLLNPGQYSFHVLRKWSEGMIQTFGMLDVQPGTSLNKQIVCPKITPQQASVRLACDWPSDLTSERLVLGLWFHFFYLETVPGIQWTWSNPDRPKQSRTIFLGPSGLVSTYTRVGSQVAPSAKGQSKAVEIREADLHPQPPGALVEFESGSYRLISLMVMRELSAAEPGRKRFERLAVAYPPENAPGHSGFYADITIELPPKYWQKINADFVAAGGATNKWTIPLPDELIRAVRKALKAENSPTDKPAAKAEAIKSSG